MTSWRGDSMFRVQIGIAAMVCLLSAGVQAELANKKCPVSNRNAKTSKSLKLHGLEIGFCCDNCKEKFAKKPKEFVDRIKFLKSRVTEEQIKAFKEAVKNAKDSEEKTELGASSQTETFPCPNCEEKSTRKPAQRA